MGMSDDHGDAPRGRRGFTLLAALAVLVLLAIFSLTFAQLMGLERRAAASFVDGVRAKLLARAGVARATVELQKAASHRPYSDPWTDGWGYARVAPADLRGRELDLLTTTAPSYAMPDPDGRVMFGSPLSYSGILGIEGSPGGASALLVYRLKVLDAPSQLDLNHPDPLVAERMLKNLLRAASLPPVAAEVLKRRPAGGFADKGAVQAAMSAAGLSLAQWKQVQDLVGVHGWVDPSVVRPWNLGDVPWRELDLLPRAPINLNTASAPVLTALFAELKARNDLGEVEVDYASAERLAGAIVAYRGTPPFTGTTRFRPFRTWLEVEAFIDQLPDSVFASAPFRKGGAVNGIDRAPALGLHEQLIARKVAHRDLVKAQLNPNTMVTKFGDMPNHGGFLGNVPRLVDKTDLVAITTEGCLDAMGVFEITSLGLILGQDERSQEGMLVLGAATHQAVVEVYRPLRLTTQADFEAHRALAMVPGDFIRTGDSQWATAYARINGMNRPTFFDGPGMPLPGWPGVVSWPNYSLVRDSGPDLALKAPHQPATWDGALTLTNLIGSKTADPDFNAGFARGRMDAIKGRAWFDPKDETPQGGWKTATPTHPADASELGRLTRPSTTAAQTPRTSGPRDPGVLDEDIAARVGAGGTRTGSGTPNPLFTGGSSLWNTGVAITPDRDGGAGPAFLAYDGDNLDLVRGTSIRFWVQPLLDPFAQETEVLLSFVGSRDGQRRQAGFRVYKEATPATGVVNIVLEAIEKTENDESGLPVEWGWASTKGGAAPRIEVDVTPSAPYASTPLDPQWIPGTWHWVVINIGPGRLGFDGVTQYFATLQVDKRKAARPLFYKGNMDLPSSIHEYGELQGHVIGDSSPYAPLTAANVNSPNAVGWVAPRLLGDYYHCDSGRGTRVITKRKEYGGPGNPAVVFQGDAIPYYPWVSPGATPGAYVPGPAWPSPLPFPILSHDHRLNLKAYDATGRAQASIPMTRDAQGVWTIVLPADRNPWFGPDGPVSRPAFTAPDGSVVGAQQVTGGYPGDAEWSIAVEAIWSETHYTRGCDVCNGEPFPADLTTLPAVEDDPYRPHFGEPLPYSLHDSGPTFKGGVEFTSSPVTGFRSWIRVDGPIDHPQGREPRFPSGPPFGKFPITYIGDDCHGCERCDVDGPVFIGGEPAGDRNYSGGTALAPVNPATMAAAVFDNVVFVNGDEARRTDWPGSSRPNITGAIDPITGRPKDYAQPGKDFEDRFFEFNLSTTLEKGGGGQVGFGAVYRRGLLELDGLRGRLGTVTWTSYPGSDLDFEVGLWRVDRAAWSPSNANLLADPSAPTWGFVDDAARGVTFATPGDPPVGVLGTAAFDALTSSDLLVLGVRLRELGSGRGDGQPIPAPLVETPIFEDLTLTLIHEQPRTLFAQEHVEE